MEDARFDQAMQRESTGDYNGAITLLSALVGDRPDFTDAFVHLASDHGMLDNFAEAEQYARKALEIDPTSGPARYYLASALRHQHRPAEAFLEMQQALTLVKQEATAGTLAEVLGGEPTLIGWAKHVEQDARTLRMIMRSSPEYYANAQVPFVVNIPPGWKKVGLFTRLLNRITGLEGAEFRPHGRKLPTIAINIVGKIERMGVDERRAFAHQWLREGRLRMISEVTIPTHSGEAVVLYYEGGPDSLQHAKASVLKKATEILLELKAESLEAYRPTYEEWVASFR